LQWTWLAAASLVWSASFVFLVSLWTRSLAWWQQHLGAVAGLRMFVRSNLARYIPGVVWQFAGLAALAVEEGVSPLAVTGAVLLQQLVLLATGIVLSLALAPALLTSSGLTLPPWLMLATALAGLLLLIVLFRRLAPHVSHRVPLPNPPWPSFASYVAGCTLGWIGYGLAFWLLGRALLGAAAPPLLLAAPAFIASYVAGIIAVFAPGGIVVREAALVAALGAQIGIDRAFLLAIAARLWAITLEIISVVVVLALHAPADDQGLRNTNTN
ncbi:MAG TPA: hypothetical protein VH137_06800, partial [Gemmatimonadales bacterium]|nr:hypothetical protein [Gemmatimonadales bacterium]